MLLHHLRGRHLKLIAAHSARHGIRGGTGLVFTFTTLVTGLVIASAFITPIEKLEQQVRAEAQAGQAGETTRALVDQVADKWGKPAIKWAIGADERQAEYLVHEKPAVISAILVVLMFSVPFLVTLGAFNQLSGDIQHKGLRYLLLRTERANLFVGRFIGTYLFTVAVLALLVAVLILYLTLKADLYPAGDVAAWLGQGFVALAIFALPHVALCSWLSAAIDSPFASLVVSQLVVGALPLLVYIGAMSQPAVGYLGYLQPWPLKYELLYPGAAHVLGASAAMIGYTAVFGAVGLWTFQARDL